LTKALSWTRRNTPKHAARTPGPLGSYICSSNTRAWRRPLGFSKIASTRPAISSPNAPYVMGASELRLRRPGGHAPSASIRRALRAFLEALAFDGSALRQYHDRRRRGLGKTPRARYAQDTTRRNRDRRFARPCSSAGSCRVEVSNGGSFIERSPLPGRGFGYAPYHSPHRLSDPNRRRRAGTCVRMLFPGPLRKS